jgi:flagellar biosynthesis protein FliR
MEFYILQFILFLLIFIRTLSLLAVAPIFSYSVIPIQVRISISVFFALALFPSLKNTLPKMNLDLLSFMLAGIVEVMIGLMIGFACSLIFYGMQLAGELIGFDIGFNVATVFDPENGTSGVTGIFLYYFALLIFLILNGHHFIFESLKLSYESIPISGFKFSDEMYKQLIKISASMFIIAVKIAAPVIVTLFLTNIALGILSRVVPQMNIFMVGFSLKIAVGIIILTMIIPFIFFIFKKLLMNFEYDIVELIRLM